MYATSITQQPRFGNVLLLAVSKSQNPNYKELKCAVNRHLRDMSRAGLQQVFLSRVERWDKYKLCKGRYFEKEW